MWKRAKELTKELLATKKGWLSILLSNVFWSSFWGIPLIIGFVLGDESLYVLAGAIYFFFWQPLVPMWIIVPVTALFIKRKILR
jgi:hypothetical protein